MFPDNQDTNVDFSDSKIDVIKISFDDVQNPLSPTELLLILSMIFRWTEKST